MNHDAKIANGDVVTVRVTEAGNSRIALRFYGKDIESALEAVRRLVHALPGVVRVSRNGLLLAVQVIPRSGSVLFRLGVIMPALISDELRRPVIIEGFTNKNEEKEVAETAAKMLR